MVRKAESEPKDGDGTDAVEVQETTPELLDHDERVGEAIETYLALAEAGNPPYPEAFVAGYPDLSDDLLRRLRAFFEVEVAGAYTGVPCQPASGIAGGLQAQFLSRVGIHQVVLEHALSHDHRSPRGNALAIERRRSEASGHGAIVDHGT